MLVILSPAKNLDFKSSYPDHISFSQPLFVEKAHELVRTLQNLTIKEIAQLMSVSEKLAELNYQRFKDFVFQEDVSSSKPAIFAYNGDVYNFLLAKTLKPDDLEFANKHLMILSGLYGIVRPFDFIQAYRLEMGCKLKNNSGEDLCSFWNKEITDSLNQVIDSQETPFLINLASNEYSSAIDRNNFKGKIIDIIFKDKIDDKLKIIGINAKKARGAAARFIIENKILNPELIKNFSHLGYEFQQDFSSAIEYVFVK